jgi:hypothetical protein
LLISGSVALPTLLVQGCGSGGDSCQQNEQAQAALMAQYLDPSTAFTCQQDSDCTVIGNTPISVAAAPAYYKYIESSAYQSLAKADTCRVMGITVNISTSECQAGRCVAAGNTAGGGSCQAIASEQQALLNQFVDTATERNCARTSDCVLVNTGGMCGEALVNRTAAQGYADYYASLQYNTLAQQWSAGKCQSDLPMGSCVQQGNPTCVQGQCVSGAYY